MNVDALFPRLAGRRWPWYMQMHLVYFSRRTLHNMLTKAGYRVVEVTPHRRVVRLSYLISRIEPYCKPLYQALDWVVRQTRQGDRLVAVDLGDIFMTFARKSRLRHHVARPGDDGYSELEASPDHRGRARRVAPDRPAPRQAGPAGPSEDRSAVGPAGAAAGGGRR